ncbi:MAG: hypothetical protein K2X47_13945 [Bdellovibrionales bacterium]|nr:hypothetical protein [Bdellovibrionales bacterium]
MNNVKHTHLLAFAFTTLMSSTAPAVDAIVYIMSGGPFDVGGADQDPYGQFLKRISSQLPGVDLSLNRNHNSNQSDVCTDIIQKKTAHPNAKVIVSGHSYGADASIWVSRCLQTTGIQVDLLLTMDTVPRNVFTTKKSLTVPENVNLNYHFFQTHDALLRGAGFNRRADQTRRSIYNVQQNFGAAPVASHLAVIKRLTEYNLAPLLIIGVIQNMTEEELNFAIRPTAERFFADYPPEPIQYPRAN